MASSLVIAGCPSNGSSTAGSGSGSSSGSPSSSSNGGLGSNTGSAFKPGGTGANDSPGSGGSGTASFITITQVVRSNVDPNGEIELVGINGTIGTNCPTADACHCVFSWTDSSGGIRQSEVPLDYFETNLARCPFSVVDPSASYFDVSLKILAGNLASNTTRVFMPTLSPNLDSGLQSNYLPVQRYMCRDMMPKGTNTSFYKTLIDPRIWNIGYGYNFYTSSLGADYGALALAKPDGGTTPVPNWECPPIPNDATQSTAYDYTLYSLGDIDVSNPSNVNIPDGQGDRTIFPNNDNLGLKAGVCVTGNESTCEKFIANRHDFYLATFKSSIFKQPVCIIHKVANRALNVINCQGIDAATGTVTLQSTVIKQTDAIGFAAMPDINEKCPDPTVVRIPAGKKWAKLWQFRASFPKRFIQDILNPGDIGTLFCSTREDTCVSNAILDGHNYTTGNGGIANGNGPTAYPPAGMNPAPPANAPSIARGILWTNTVCYNTRNPTGQGLPFQQEPIIQSNPTSPGMGNCDQNGKAGDGHGPAENFNAGYTDAGTGVTAGSGRDPACNRGDYFLANTAGVGQGVIGGVNKGPGGGTIATPGPYVPGTGDTVRLYFAGCDHTQQCIPKDGNNNPMSVCCQDSGNPTSGLINTAQLPANYTPNGGQWCNPALIGSHDSSSQAVTYTYISSNNPTATSYVAIHPAGDSVPVGQDIWLLGNGTVRPCIEADTDGNGNLHSIFQGTFPPAAPAGAFQMTSKVLDAAAPNDIVYVVSPDTVRLSDMQNPNGVIARKYTPYRIFQNSDVSQRVVYQLDAGANNSSTASQRLSQYPLCVLQDAQSGIQLFNGGAP